MFNTLRNDIYCVKQRDPAARSVFEVIFCYPGYRAVRSYRFAHRLHKMHLCFLARLVSDWTRFFTGVEIHPAATIGQRLFIDHGEGVVIGETAVIGDDVTIYQGATLGGTGKETGKRHPTIGNHVTISAGAAVLGPFSVGEYAKIGAGSVVLSEVPPHATVVGVPGRVVRMNGICKECTECIGVACKKIASVGGESGVDLDQIHLPDPIASEIEQLKHRIDQLESAMKNSQ